MDNLGYACVIFGSPLASSTYRNAAVRFFSLWCVETKNQARSKPSCMVFIRVWCAIAEMIISSLTKNNKWLFFQSFFEEFNKRLLLHQYNHFNSFPKSKNNKSHTTTNNWRPVSFQSHPALRLRFY